MSFASNVRSRESGGRPLTGGRVLLLLVSFFGTVAAVDAGMIYAALTTFRGEDTSHAYEKGLAYNRNIAVAREQSAREWKVEASIRRGQSMERIVSVALRDAAGADLSGLKVTATIRAPVDGKKDLALQLKETSPGRYEASGAIDGGWRDLVLSAERDSREVFRSKSRIHIE